VPNRALRLSATPEQQRRGAELMRHYGLDEGQPYAIINVGAKFGAAKCWLPERFAEVGDRAAQQWGARVLIFGSSMETAICRRVCDSMSSPALNLSGRTSLRAAIGLISRCSFFVTNDSGLMHIAAALNVPTVAIFGPTDPVATGPQGPKTRIVRHETACAPCLKPECPEDHACMLDIRPGEVWEAVERLWRDVS
jgi:heptosyltransferase-2